MGKVTREVIDFSFSDLECQSMFHIQISLNSSTVLWWPALYPFIIYTVLGNPQVVYHMEILEYTIIRYTVDFSSNDFQKQSSHPSLQVSHPMT